MLPSVRQLVHILLAIGMLESGLLCAQLSEADASDEQASQEPEEERRIKRLGDEEGEEFELDLRVPQTPGARYPADATAALPDPQDQEALQSLLRRLAARPSNRSVLEELEAFLKQQLSKAHGFGDEGDIASMRETLVVLQEVDPRLGGLEAAFGRLADLDRLDQWLEYGRSALRDGRLVRPEAESALHWFDRVLTVRPDHPEAYSGKDQIIAALLGRAMGSAREYDFERSLDDIVMAEEIGGGPTERTQAARDAIRNIRQQEATAIESEVELALSQGKLDLAEFRLIDLIALVGNSDSVDRLQKAIDDARAFGRYQAGQVVQDALIGAGGSGPAVVVIPPGSFLMGSGEDESGRSEHEGPRHRVTFARGFAIGLQEVTVGQFRAFVDKARYRTQAERDGRSRVYDHATGRIISRPGIYWVHNYVGERAGDNDPVLHVTWNDAKAYTRWLSEVTGQAYRLPTEAEFEYALRAGTTTRYWWGDGRPESAVENLTGAEDQSPLGRVWTSGFRRYTDGYWGPAPGASFPPNPWGLHDMAGNVSEWVEDCWHDSYARAPRDGSAWVNAGCARKVVRGGYWASAPDQSRSASRLSAGVNLSGPRVGFRVARDL